MASVSERLARLQGRITPPLPPHEPSPQMALLLKMANHYRAELDHADRVHEAEGRGRLEAGEPPEPLSLTLDEKRQMLADVPWWLNYLEAARERAPDELVEVITAAIVTSRESARKLREEIELEEAMQEGRQQ